MRITHISYNIIAQCVEGAIVATITSFIEFYLIAFWFVSFTMIAMVIRFTAENLYEVLQSSGDLRTTEWKCFDTLFYSVCFLFHILVVNRLDQQTMFFHFTSTAVWFVLY